MRQHEQAGVGRGFADAAAGVDATSVRQAQLHKCDIGREPAPGFYSRGHRSRFADDPDAPSLIQDRSYTRSRDLMSIDDQQPDTGGAFGLIENGTSDLATHDPSFVGPSVIARWPAGRTESAHCVNEVLFFLGF